MEGGRFLALRPDAPWHDKLEGASDQLGWAWIKMLCRAKQMERSSFPTREALSGALSVDPELLVEMIRRQLVDERRTGVEIHDWGDHQVTFDLEKHRASAAARKRRQRARQKKQEVPDEPQA